MKSNVPIDFETYYFQELLQLIRTKSTHRYTPEEQAYLDKLLSFLERGEDAQSSIEKLAGSQNTSDLAIFFSDLLEQLRTTSPETALENRDSRAEDFLELFRVFLQNEEWKSAIDRELGEGETPSPVAGKEVSLQDYCRDMLRESIERAAAEFSPDMQATYRDFMYQALEQPQTVQELAGRVGDPVVRDFASLHQRLVAIPENADAVDAYMKDFSANCKEWISLSKDVFTEYSNEIAQLGQPEAAAEMEAGETTLEALFDQVVTEEEPEADTEATSGELEELLKQAEALEKSKPTPTVDPREQRQRRLELRDYIVSEVETSRKEILEFVSQLVKQPEDSEAAGHLQECLKSLKDLGQIHQYPGIEKVAREILQVVQALGQLGKPLTRSEKVHIDAVLSYLPAYVDALINDNDEVVLNQIEQKLAELRQVLPEGREALPLQDQQTLEASLQDVARRSARQLEEALSSDDPTARLEESLSAIDNLLFWSETLNLPAIEPLRQIREILTSDRVTHLSGVEQQAILMVLRQCESAFVNTPAETWQAFADQLRGAPEQEVVEEPVEQAAEAEPVVEAGEEETAPADAETSSLGAFQEVTLKQLSELSQTIKAAPNAGEVLVTDFRQFLTNLLETSNIIQNDELELLCRLGLLKLADLEGVSPVHSEEVQQQLIHFVETLHGQIAALPQPVESENLLKMIDDLVAACRMAAETGVEEEATERFDVETYLETSPDAGPFQAPEATTAAEPSPGDESKEEISRVFRMEAQNYISEFYDYLNRVRQNLADTRSWRRLGVVAHTLKGAAQMVGEETVASLAEPLDKTVDLIENEALEVTPELIDIFHRFVEAMEACVEGNPGEYGTLLQELNRYITDRAREVAKPGVPETEAETSPPTPAPEVGVEEEFVGEKEEFIRLKEQDPELLEIFQTEVASNFDVVEKNLTNLEKFSYDKEAVQEIERAVHDIRGASRMLGLTEISEITDRLEQTFEALVQTRSQEYKVVIPVARKAMFIIRELSENRPVRAAVYHQVVQQLDRFLKGEAVEETVEEAPASVTDVEGEPPGEAVFTDTAGETTGEEEPAPFTEAEESLIEATATTEEVLADYQNTEPTITMAEEEEVTAEATPPPETEAAPAEAEAPPEEKPPVSPELLEVYLQEAREQLEDIDYLLLQLEKDPENAELQHHLMRCMHTLKGSSGMVRAHHVETLAHRCEDLMEHFSRSKTSVPPELFDLFGEVVEEITTQLDCLGQSGTEQPKRYRELLQRLEGWLQKAPVEQPAAAEQPAAEPAPTEAGAPAPSEAAEEEKLVTLVPPKTEPATPKETQVRLSIKTMNLFLNLAAELVIGHNQFKNQLDRLKTYLPMLNANLKIFRDTEDYLNNLLKEEKRIQESLLPLVEDQPGIRESWKNQIENLQRVLKNVKMLQDEVNTLLHTFKENSKTYDENLQKITKLSNELLNEIMQARMVHINLLFQRFHRPIRDLARQLKKQIRLSIQGENTELDRALIDELYEPLLHIIRNAIDHGLESPEERKAAGKPPEGLLTIKATSDRNQVTIEISDDGRGIDLEQVKASAIEKGLLTEEDAARMTEQELFEYLFYPGFSTARETTLVSGRGVGLDAVKAQIEKAKGDIRIYTEKGKGTTFSIRVPASLSVIQSMLVEVNGHVYSIPLMQVEETLNISGQDLLTEDGKYFISYREQRLPVIRLNQLLKIRQAGARPLSSEGDYPLIIVQDEGNRVALLVDKIIHREEILIKSLGPGLRRLRYISGGSIMANGQVVLVVDVQQIISEVWKGREPGEPAPALNDRAKADATPSQAPARPRRRRKVVRGRKPVALIVDDSLSIRKYLSSLLMQRGFVTDTARNGYEALELLNKQEFDIMVTDLEMPKLSGYELIETLRYDQRFQSFPIIVLTGRAGENFRQLTTELGADAYIVKPFKEKELFEQMEKLIDYQPQ